MSFEKHYDKRKETLANHVKINSLDDIRRHNQVSLEGKCEIKNTESHWWGQKNEGILKLDNGQEVEFTYGYHTFYPGPFKFGEKVLDYLKLHACAQEGRQVSLYGRLKKGKSGYKLTAKYVDFDGRLSELKVDGKSLEETWDNIFFPDKENS